MRFYDFIPARYRGYCKGLRRRYGASQCLYCKLAVDKKGTNDEIECPFLKEGK